MKNLFFFLFLAALFVISAPQNSAAQTKSHWVSPKAGVWQLSGKDEENINWTGQIVFTKKTYSNKSIVKYKGYIDWSSPDDESSGQEYFTGSFDRRTGKLVLKGTSLKIVSGDLALGVYTGFVNRKGRQIRRGSWDGVDIVKGKWSAKWLKSR
jgi:PKD repeat protein